MGFAQFNRFRIQMPFLLSNHFSSSISSNVFSETPGTSSSNTQVRIPTTGDDFSSLSFILSHQGFCFLSIWAPLSGNFPRPQGAPSEHCIAVRVQPLAVGEVPIGRDADHRLIRIYTTAIWLKVSEIFGFELWICLCSASFSFTS
jgi:hypothetical protein